MMDLSPFKHDIFALGILLLLMALAKFLVSKVLYKYYLGYRNIQFKTEVENARLGLSFYRLLYFASAVFVGFFVLRYENWVFDMKELSKPLSSIPERFKFYYKYATSFYLVEIATIFFEPGKKDFYQMLLHHIVTLTLMALSYNKKIIKFGLAILLLHDVSDPLLELCKIENRFKNTMMANIVFCIFAIVFMAMRLVIYPSKILLTVYHTLWRKGITYSEIIVLIFLFALQIMHLIWTKFIIIILLKVFKNENATDVREKEKSE